MKRFFSSLLLIAICVLSFAACQGGCAHEYGEWTAQSLPTCTEAGTEDRVCALCGEKEQRLTPMLGHACDAFVAESPAACEKNATERATCSRCGSDVIRELAGTALAHQFASKYTTIPPAPGEQCGVKYRPCTNPGCTARTDEMSYDPNWTDPIK